MKTAFECRRHFLLSVGGGLAQAAFSVTALLIGRWTGLSGLQAAAGWGLAGILPWMWLALHHYLQSQVLLKQQAVDEFGLTTMPEKTKSCSAKTLCENGTAACEETGTDETEDQSANPDDAPTSHSPLEKAEFELDCARKFVAFTEDFFSPFFSMLMAAFLVWAGKSFFTKTWEAGKNGISLSVMPLQALSLMAGWCLFAYGITYFFRLMSQKDENRNAFSSGLKYLSALQWNGVLFLVGLAAAHFKSVAVLYYVTLFISGFMVVTSFELILLFVLDFFRPHKKGEALRPPFDSRLLGIVLHSDTAGRTLWEAMDYQFGFEVSGSWFLRLCARWVWLWAFLVLGSLVTLSCIVVIEPGQKALVFRFGRLQADSLDEGLHWKAPWPIDFAAVYDVQSIRRLHVGSHKPETAGGEIYRADVPILWSNQHGLGAEEFLIVAPSADSMQLAADTLLKSGQTILGGNSKPPSVNLMGGDIFVEYRISDLKLFALASTDTERLFTLIAEAETSRELFRYDIDSLLGNGRITAESNLLVRLRAAAKLRKLGIEVLKVGFAGTHPPMDVADAFHETIIARQEKITAVQNAGSYAARTKIEAAGTLSQADGLIEQIDFLEKAQTENNDAAMNQALRAAENRLMASGGKVAETMADARGYRWWRENEERGKSERFLRELDLFRIGPAMFPSWQYLSTLEQGLAQARKFMLLADRDNMVLRFNFVNPAAMSDVAGAATKIPGPPVWTEGGDTTQSGQSAWDGN